MASHLRKRGLDILVQALLVGGDADATRCGLDIPVQALLVGGDADVTKDGALRLHDAKNGVAPAYSSAGRRRYEGQRTALARRQEWRRTCLLVGGDADATSLGVLRSVSVSLTRKTTT